MSNDYLVPSLGEPDELVRSLSPAGIQLLAPESVREFILSTHGENLTVSMIRPSELIVLQRHANTLVDVLPTIVMSVPGLVYSHEWAGIAATFPAIDWLEFRNKFRKSGSTAFDPATMSERHAGKHDATVSDLDEDAIGEQ